MIAGLRPSIVRKTDINLRPLAVAVLCRCAIDRPKSINKKATILATWNHNNILDMLCHEIRVRSYGVIIATNISLNAHINSKNADIPFKHSMMSI